MKITSKKYRYDMKNVEQISIKFGGFYLIKMSLVQTVLWTSTSKYRWIFKRLNLGRYIGRSPVHSMKTNY